LIKISVPELSIFVVTENGVQKWICPDHDYCNGIFAFLLTADEIIEYILIYRGEYDENISAMCFVHGFTDFPDLLWVSDDVLRYVGKAGKGKTAFA